MLYRLGHSTAITRSLTAIPLSSRTLSFMNSLPSDFIYERNDTVSTYRDGTGVLRTASLNVPRYDHTMTGVPIGLKIEGAMENKCTNNNVTPSSTVGLTVSVGTPLITFPDDLSALETVGLHEIGGGKVIKIDNSANGDSCSVDFDGACGNVNPHSFSIWARMGAGNGDLRRTGSGTSTAVISGNSYKRYRLENEIPSFTGVKMRVRLNPGAVMYCLLNQIEESLFTTSEILVTGASATRQQDIVYCNNLVALPYFDETQGYIALRYHPTRQLEGDIKYLMVASDGTTANTIGLRLDGNNSLRGFVRSASANKHSAGNNDYHLMNQTHVAGISWEDNQTAIVSGGLSNTQTYTGNPTGISRLNVGTLSGATGLFWGHIQSLSMGKTAIDLTELASRMYSSNDIVVASGGQSLMKGHFDTQETGSEAPKQIFRDIVGQSFPNKVTVFADGATGSSAASKTTQSTNYWWDLTTSTRGDAFNNFYSSINDGALKPTAIIWSQGEQDSHQIGSATSRAQYKAALIAIFNDMHESLGNIPIFIQKIGRRTYFFNTGGMQAVREVQMEIIEENPLVFFGAETFDQPLHDATHLTDTGYEVVAERLAYRVSSFFNNEMNENIGPYITTLTRDGLTVDITFDHDGGTNFTPISNIEGFHFYDDATEIFLSDAIQLSPNQIRLILSSLPTGIESLYYFYDGELTINTNSLVLDNADPSYPLQGTKILL